MMVKQLYSILIKISIIHVSYLSMYSYFELWIYTEFLLLFLLYFWVKTCIWMQYRKNHAPLKTFWDINLNTITQKEILTNWKSQYFFCKTYWKERFYLQEYSMIIHKKVFGLFRCDSISWKIHLWKLIAVASDMFRFLLRLRAAEIVASCHPGWENME